MLVATGAQAPNAVQVFVVDRATSAPLQGVAVTVATSTASTDAQGQVTLALPNPTPPFDVTVNTPAESLTIFGTNAGTITVPIGQPYAVSPFPSVDVEIDGVDPTVDNTALVSIGGILQGSGTVATITTGSTAILTIPTIAGNLPAVYPAPAEVSVRLVDSLQRTTKTGHVSIASQVQHIAVPVTPNTDEQVSLQLDLSALGTGGMILSMVSLEQWSGQAASTMTGGSTIIPPGTATPSPLTLSGAVFDPSLPTLVQLSILDNTGSGVLGSLVTLEVPPGSPGTLVLQAGAPATVQPITASSQPAISWTAGTSGADLVRVHVLVSSSAGFVRQWTGIAGGSNIFCQVPAAADLRGALTGPLTASVTVETLTLSSHDTASSLDERHLMVPDAQTVSAPVTLSVP
jgi:hypothetical protein